MDGGQVEVIPLFPLGTPLFPGVVLPLQVFEPRYRRLMADLTGLPADSEGRRFGVVAIRQGWEVERVAPAEALYDVGCTAVLRAVALQPDGGYQVVTVGSDRFRLLDVLVTEDPPYLQARVEWLDEEEAAEEAAGNADGLVGPDGGLAAAADDVAASVARGSLEVLTGNVRDLFARYVTEVTRRQAGASAEELADLATAGTEAGSPAAMLQEVTDDPRGLSYLVASAALLTTEDRQALLAESATRRRLALESRLLRRELVLLRTVGAVPVPLQEFAGPMTPN
ncbi:LON peptidase substrate-binding domain-containing protein [Modestobacter lapidis]|nr:LON peptidase substrate-binding domain-containing protein [Modestobacter lapidis]